VANVDVSGQVNIIGQDRMRTNNTVVGDMHIRHEEAMISNRSLETCFCSAIDGAILTDSNIIADFKRRTLPFKFEILGRSAYHSSWINIAVVTHPGSVENAGIGSDPATISDHHIFFNSSEGPYLDISPDFRVSMDVIH
jgi:hypothetical protein